MNIDRKTRLTNTEAKALEFARMHDDAVDKALMRNQEDKAAVHRTAALFLREAVPALCKSVAELDARIAFVAAESQELRDEVDARGKRMDGARNSLKKIIANTKSNIEYLRRGKQDPANASAIKLLEENHDQLVQLRDVLKLK